MFQRRHVAVVISTIAVALTSACGQIANGATISDELTSSNEREEWVPGPLDEFWGQVSLHPQGSLQEMWEQTVRDHLAAEELVAACMAAHGFDYVIQPEPLINRPFITAELDWSAPYGSREWAEIYGFALSTTDINNPPRELPPWEREHHAAELLADMSPGEQDAWLYALYGPARNNWGALEPGTCHGDAQATMWWNRVDDAPTAFQPLIDDIIAFESSIQSGTATPIRNLNLEWQACMVGTGLQEDWENPLDLRWSLIHQWNSLENQLRWEPSPAREAAFQEREIALAVADWDCRESVDYDSRHRDIDIELQQEFVDQRRGDLEAWVIYVNESRQATHS